ncbi:MAG TPA: hypothetical protein VGD40_08940 [Chryseosolibacter sp.]
MVNEKEVERLVTETSNLIDAMLEVVLPDFMRVTNLLKSLNGTLTDEAELKAYGYVMQELQYYDTLTQKMEHIKTIHTLVLESLWSGQSASGAKVSGLSLIRLNHIQFQVACFEYLSSVNEIESNLRVLLNESKGSVHYSFEYSNLLLSASRFINTNFTVLEKALQEAKDADLQNNVERVSAIYSMESERSVLQAYINKPLLHDGEIEPLHKSNRQPEIDLF